jgi:ADP-heptose:LPS heptosyltransferase
VVELGHEDPEVVSGDAGDMTSYLNRILVVKLADIGDAVLALPAIQSLDAAFPDAQIDVLTTAAGANVFKMSDSVDSVITLAKERFDHVRGLISPGGFTELAKLTFKLRTGRYDAIVLLHHSTTSFGARKFRALVSATGAPIVAGLDNGRGDFLTDRAPDYGFGAVTEWQYNLEVVATLGASRAPLRPRITIPKSVDTRVAQKLCDANVPAEFAVMHAEVGEFSPARAWRDDYFREVADSIQSGYGLPVLLVGIEPRRRGIATICQSTAVVNMTGETTFEELCSVIRRASLVIGCDSSVTHLAGAFDRPVMALFGPSNISAWRPFGSETVTPLTPIDPHARSVALHIDLPCSPCIYTGFGLGRPRGCPSRACMMDMTPDYVLELLPTLLGTLDSAEDDNCSRA